MKQQLNLAKATAKDGIGELPDQTKQITTNEDKNVIQGEYHTLFIEEEDPIFEDINVEIDGKPFLLEDNPLIINKEAIPKHKRYTLFVEMFGHEKTQLHQVIYELRKAGENDIFEIRIDSPGGFIKEGITLYNVMREKFNERTVTYLDSTAYSMGALLFSMGNQRIAYEHSSLMYHNYSAMAYGKGDNLKTYIEHEEKNTHEFFKSIIVAKGFLTENEYDDMVIGRDVWLDCYEIASRGIATHIIAEGITIESSEYVEYRDSGMTLNDFMSIKFEALLNDMEVEEDAKSTPKPKKKKKTTKKKTTKKSTGKDKPSKKEEKPKKTKKTKDKK